MNARRALRIATIVLAVLWVVAVVVFFTYAFLIMWDMAKHRWEQ